MGVRDCQSKDWPSDPHVPGHVWSVHRGQRSQLSCFLSPLGDEVTVASASMLSGSAAGDMSGRLDGGGFAPLGRVPGCLLGDPGVSFQGTWVVSLPL